MRIEYHPALIFLCVWRGFLKSRVYTHSVAEFHSEVSKLVFSPQGNYNFHAFLKWRNYFVYARTCFFFSSSDGINPAAAGPPSVPRIRSGSHVYARYMNVNIPPPTPPNPHIAKICISVHGRLCAGYQLQLRYLTLTTLDYTTIYHTTVRNTTIHYNTLQ